MIYPTISKYIESIRYAEDNFATLTNLRPVLDEDGDPVMSSGNFAVVFKMQDIETKEFFAIKCFTREQDGRAELYKAVSEEFSKITSKYIVSVNYLNKELFVNSSQTGDNEFPILQMNWVEGQTLSSFLKETEEIVNKSIHFWSHEEEDTALFELRCLPKNFVRMASWLLRQPFAHGDIKPDNIILKTDGSLVLVDYDGMYTPSMCGMKKPYNGTPNYIHPHSTANDFNDQIDNYAISIMLLSLCAFSIKPQLLSQYEDFCIINNKESLQLYSHVIFNDSTLMNNALFQESLALFLHTLSQNHIDSSYFEHCFSNHLIPKDYDYSLTGIIEYDKEHFWEDKYGVRYSLDGRKVLGSKDNLNGADYRIREGVQIICDKAFQDRALHSIILPDTVKSIGDRAFANNDNMEYCNIPSSVIFIYDNNPWGGCFNIKQMDCQSPNFLIHNGILYSNDFQIVYGFIYWHPNVVIHPKAKKIAGNAFWASRTNYDSLIKSINLSNIVQIGAAAFYRCTSALFSIPDTLAKIEKGAFYGCEQIRTINLSQVKVISEESFKGCKGLKEVTLSDELEIINDKAFSGCNNLKTINIPAKTVFISDNSFHECTALKEVIVDEKNKFFCSIDGVLFNLSVTKLIKYPSAKTDIEYIIPITVNEIADEAFSNCHSLVSIKGNNKVLRIGKFVFNNCTNITDCSIELDDGSDNESFWRLGRFLYALKTSKEESKERGYEYIEKAALLDHPAAQLFIAKSFRFGWHKGVINTEKYIYWLKKSASHNTFEAMSLLGLEYVVGKNISKNYQKALELLTQIEESGIFAEIECKGKHYACLGLIYELGLGVNKDLNKAIKYYQKGVKWEDSIAEITLGRCYEKGIGVIVDLQKAKELYQSAKEHNHNGAEEALERVERLIKEQEDELPF